MKNGCAAKYNWLVRKTKVVSAGPSRIWKYELTALVVQAVISVATPFMMMMLIWQYDYCNDDDFDVDVERNNVMNHPVVHLVRQKAKVGHFLQMAKRL